MLTYFPYSANKWKDADNPYEELAKDLAFGSPKYIFMHHHFEGATHAECEFVPDGGIPLSVIPEGAKVICGHYHQRQTLTHNGRTVVEYVGVPLQHDFGESGYYTGYSVLDTDEDTLVPINVDVAPKFYKVQATDETKLEDIPGRHELDYYRLDIPVGEVPSSFEELTNGLTKTKIKRLKVDTLMRSRVEQALPGVETLTITDVIEAYTILNTEEGERRDHLLKLGLNLVNSGGV